MKIIFAGGDIGNDGMKLVLGIGNRLFIPNAVKEVAHGTERKSIGEDEKVLDTLDVIIRCTHLPELDGRRFWVGNLAVGKGEYQVSPDTKKRDNPLILVPLFTGLALQADKKEDDLHTQVTMGLPMEEFLEKNERKSFETRIKGDFEVEFVSTHRMEGWKVKIRFDPTLAPEGLGIILHQMTNQFGQNIKPEWKGQAMGCIDIGGFSTDISAIGSDHRPDADLCDGFQLGTISALDGVGEEINRLYKIKFPRHMLEETITKKNCQLQLGAKQIDITDIVDSNFRSVAHQIAQRVLEITRKPKAAMIHRYFVVGGGALKYEQFLENELQEKMYSELIWLTTDPEETVFLNAESFYRLAILKAYKANLLLPKIKEA
ncbi:plasmid segregation protein ParM [Brevibacillus sp. IT-7CA2]|uniref:ParM/StbA family protein n=1 Tax=Brevibacillus sp. IT-7CA2 TaxID=3026436 RepID=UPI0039E10966